MDDGNYAGLRGGKEAALSINSKKKEEAASAREKKPKYQAPQTALEF